MLKFSGKAPRVFAGPAKVRLTKTMNLYGRRLVEFVLIYVHHQVFNSERLGMEAVLAGEVVKVSTRAPPITTSLYWGASNELLVVDREMSWSCGTRVRWVGPACRKCWR